MTNVTKHSSLVIIELHVQMIDHCKQFIYYL